MEVIKQIQAHQQEIIAAWAALAATWLVIHNFLKAFHDAFASADGLHGSEKFWFVFWKVVSYLGTGKRA